MVMHYRLIIPIITLLMGAWSPASAQMITFDKEKHDFGRFSPDKTELTHSFTFTNEGNRPVKLKSVKTSCGCTTPKWPRDPIEPGNKGNVKVVYDATTSDGYFRKSVTVVTANGSLHELTIEGEQTPEKSGSRLKGYSIEQGALAFKEGYVDFGHIPLSSKDTGYLTIYNSGNGPMRLVKLRRTKLVQAPRLPRTVQPGQETKVMLTYTSVNSMAGLKKNLGIKKGQGLILTNDQSKPYKEFGYKTSIYPPVKEDENSEKSPTAKLNQDVIQLGTVGGNNVIKTGAVLKNTGDAPLVIKGTDSKGCGCEAPVPNKNRLKPGEQTTLRVTINTNSYSGRLNKELDIYTNDPDNPYVTLQLKAYAE